MASLLELFHSTGSEENLSPLLSRGLATEIFYEGPAELSPLLTTLIRIGSLNELDTWVSAVVHHTDLTQPDFVEEVVQTLWHTGSERGIHPLVDVR
ncbi:hypothetical protein [Streptomyces sp. NPDC049906]|uniref:hypothetical protein n=1 Tax=Streptomyces sp. NPDC049906 TaxID=3155656 RepID=UPI0034239107